MKPVLLYSKSWCGYCTAAKRLLDSRGVPYSEIDLDLQPERRYEMLDRSEGMSTVPQIFIGERHVGGFRELRGLQERGELDAWLAD